MKMSPYLSVFLSKNICANWCHKLLLQVALVCLLGGGQELFSATGPSDFGAHRIGLAGTWRFALDPKGTGEAEKWFASPLTDTVKLPGTISQNRKGPRAKPTDAVKELSSEYPYEGVAWYQRTIEVPKEWKGRCFELFLERTKLTKVWLDDVSLGGKEALGVAQVYRLGELSPGSHRLTVRVDSKTTPAGTSGHMLDTSTQTRWNGLIGDLHLAAHDPVWIRQMRVTPDVANKTATVTLFIGNDSENPQSGQIQISGTPFNVPEAKDRKPVSHTTDFTAVPGGSAVSISLPLGADALLWDEFHPALYRLVANLETEAIGGKKFRDASRAEFGLREFKAKDGQFTINGRITMLRGKHDALVFPVPGHVAMDLQEWMRVLRIAKSYGINHYRFHTCTPPEAAFQAADRVGIYLQPELYKNGGTYREGVEGEYHLAEGKRILNVYGNHPSFVMLSLGNEIWGGRDIRAKMVAELRKSDPTRLYVQGSNNEFSRPALAEGDDYWTTGRTMRSSADHSVRGSFAHADDPNGHIQSLRPATTYDYREVIKTIPVPVIGHEVGQFQVFPDFREIKKYTGVQKPWNLETFRRRLKSAGMLDQADAFVAASGALAVQCYREEVETALRTPGFGGFQLLDLQDYPGQGTALVGILNAFMESKGLITPDAWRNFGGPVVPLARMSSYTWTSSQTFSAQIEVAQYGPADLKQVPLVWTLANEQGQTVARGELPTRDYGPGLIQAGTVTIPLAKLAVPARYRLQLRLGSTGYHNEYPLWIYPDQADTAQPPSVSIREAWDAGTQELLRAGKTVLLMPPPENVSGIDGYFTPDFWCYTMFRSISEGNKKPVAPGTLGLLIEAGHPALASFPTESHSDWQWWDLVMGSRAVVLDATPASFRPIVQVIDNFDRNEKLGVLFEAKVEKGKLIVCTLDLLHKQDSPVARQMLHSLLQYGSTALPRTTLPIETVNAIFAPAKQVFKKRPDGSYSEFFERKD